MLDRLRACFARGREGHGVPLRRDGNSFQRLLGNFVVTIRRPLMVAHHVHISRTRRTLSDDQKC